MRAVIIPARHASTRLPGKPLLAETGKPLIQHVVEAAARAKTVDRVVVATDHRGIWEAVRGFGGEAVMTSRRHPTGTDRVAEAAAKIDLTILSYIVYIFAISSSVTVTSAATTSSR